MVAQSHALRWLCNAGSVGAEEARGRREKNNGSGNAGLGRALSVFMV